MSREPHFTNTQLTPPTAIIIIITDEDEGLDGSVRAPQGRALLSTTTTVVSGCFCVSAFRLRPESRLCHTLLV